MMTSPKWEIAVDAGSYYPALTQEFFGDDIRLTYENDENGMQFFAYSQHIDELDDLSHVARRLYSLQLIFNGALRVYWGNAHNVLDWDNTHDVLDWGNTHDVSVSIVRFVSFTLCDSGGSHNVHADTIEDCPFRLNPVIDTNLVECIKTKKCFASVLINLSRTDTDLRQILFLIGLISSNSPIERILTWGTLYKILDSVRHHSKINGLKINNLADMDRIDEFTAACNNMSILGLDARHGAAANAPPKNVITDLSKATDLIVSLASKFCRAYVEAKHPVGSS